MEINEECRTFLKYPTEMGYKLTEWVESNDLAKRNVTIQEVINAMEQADTIEPVPSNTWIKEDPPKRVAIILRGTFSNGANTRYFSAWSDQK